MGKKVNPMLARRDAAIYEAYMQRLSMANQMGLDAAIIAANEVFGMGAGRAKQFREAYINAMNTMARMIVEDGKDDPETVHSRDQIDRRIKSIVGQDNFEPWDERYKKKG